MIPTNVLVFLTMVGYQQSTLIKLRWYLKLIPRYELLILKLMLTINLVKEIICTLKIKKLADSPSRDFSRYLDFPLSTALPQILFPSLVLVALLK